MKTAVEVQALDSSSIPYEPPTLCLWFGFIPKVCTCQMPYEYLWSYCNTAPRYGVFFRIFATVILLHPEFHRRHAEMIFHVLSEERRVWKTCYIADLLDALVGLFQVVAYILKHVLCYPLVGSLAKRRKVFRGDVEFCGIPFDCAMLHL